MPLAGGNSSYRRETIKVHLKFKFHVNTILCDVINTFTWLNLFNEWKEDFISIFTFI